MAWALAAYALVGITLAVYAARRAVRRRRLETRRASLSQQNRG